MREASLRALMGSSGRLRGRVVIEAGRALFPIEQGDEMAGRTWQTTLSGHCSPSATVDLIREPQQSDLGPVPSLS